MGPVEIILNLAASFAATAAFCFIFDIPRRHVVSCALMGTGGWMVYLLLTPLCGDVAATFISACTVVLASRLLAVVRKCPVSVMLIPGIIPLVPGSASYYCAYNLVTGNNVQAASYGLLTLKIALAIVLGIIVVSAVPLPGGRNGRRTR